MSNQLDHYRLLGRSGLRVSPLTLGTMSFASDGWGSSEEEAAEMVDTYIDRGGNFVDTANLYGKGGSEEWLAKIVGDRRQKLVISTKYTFSMDPTNINAGGNHRRSMVRAVEESLRRLKTDYIDLYYLHVWDSVTPVDEILRAFDDLVTSGKILYIGLSDTPAWQASRMQMMAELRGWNQFCALQIPYSLIQRTTERELIPMAAEVGFGVCPWSPLGAGMLSGKYTRADLENAQSRTASGAKGIDMTSRRTMNESRGMVNEKNIAIAETVAEIASEIGATSPQVAIAWALRNPAVTSPVLGARTPDQLKDNLGALDITLTDEQAAKLDTVSAIEPGFPNEMLQTIGATPMVGTANLKPRR